jgi:hypothetical protein
MAHHRIPWCSISSEAGGRFCRRGQVTPKDKSDAGAEAGAVVCCRTEPDAGPEGCLCEEVAKDVIMVTGTSCSTATTVNGQVVDFTGYVVSTCP